VADAADAAGGLSLRGLNDYLLTNTAGLGRVATVLTLALAAFAARHRPRLAAVGVSAAFLAMAISGHANSADPRTLAILTDWIHLIAGAVWIGGIAQIVLTWAVPVTNDPRLRRALIGGVLARFGRVALPAFLVVVLSGLVNALIELGHPSELWQSGYGRALAVKMSLVGLVALFSYIHALRLRPRLLAANPHPQPKWERRHWRLLRSEPGVALGVVAVAALLVAFPLPPRQLAGVAKVVAGPACNPCPLPSAKDDQLAVADHVGPAIAAVWLKRESNGLSGRLRLLGDQLKPVPGRPTIPGAALSSCGPGCWDLRIRGYPATIDVKAPVDGRSYAVRLPARWVQGPGASQRARDLLVRVQNTMNRLRSLHQYEQVTSGPGSLAGTHFRLQAPNRFAYRTNVGSEAITIGKRSWDKIEVNGTRGGVFYVNEFGDVLVPDPDGGAPYWAGYYDGVIEFTFETKVISSIAPPGLQPGDAWPGPHAGIRYVLMAGGSDIKYTLVDGRRTAEVRLSDNVGRATSSRLANRLAEVKGTSGGRVYINERCEFFGPVSTNDYSTFLYLGNLGEDLWFRAPDGYDRP
jgi:putative copper export protein